MTNPFRQPAEPPPPQYRPWQEVVVRGLSIPFGDMVVLLVKLAFAAIPAMIIIAFVWFALFVVLGGLAGVLPE